MNLKFVTTIDQLPLGNLERGHAVGLKREVPP